MPTPPFRFFPLPPLSSHAFYFPLLACSICVCSLLFVLWRAGCFVLPVQMFGVFVGVLRIFPRVFDVRHEGLAEEGQHSHEETAVGGRQ